MGFRVCVVCCAVHVHAWTNDTVSPESVLEIFFHMAHRRWSIHLTIGDTKRITIICHCFCWMLLFILLCFIFRLCRVCVCVCVSFVAVNFFLSTFSLVLCGFPYARTWFDWRWQKPVDTLVASHHSHMLCVKAFSAPVWLICELRLLRIGYRAMLSVSARERWRNIGGSKRNRIRERQSTVRATAIATQQNSVYRETASATHQPATHTAYTPLSGFMWYVSLWTNQSAVKRSNVSICIEGAAQLRFVSRWISVPRV